MKVDFAQRVFAPSGSDFSASFLVSSVSIAELGQGNCHDPTVPESAAAESADRAWTPRIQTRAQHFRRFLALAKNLVGFAVFNAVLAVTS
jgi:hypothetical protein